MNQLSRGIRTIQAGRPFGGALLLVLGWLLLMRGIMLVHSGVWPNPGWVLLADVVGAVVLALLLSVVRISWIRLPLILLMGAAFYGAGAHMGAHGTIFRVSHAGKLVDPVLVTSSVATPWLLLLPVYCALAYLLHRLHLRIDPRPPVRPFLRLAVAGVCIAAYGVSVTSLTYPANNVVVSSLAQIPGSVAGLGGPPAAERIEPLSSEIRDLFFHHEVRGGRFGDQPNILVVVIEGLSAGYLPTVAEYHELSPAVQLPMLEEQLERRGFRIYRNVLSMQRQTDRGSYSMLCGTYPRLGTTPPEMTDIAAGEADPTCVPEVLARNGYRTGYLQAAPLEFMNKDRFMPEAGFERVDGAGYFRSGDDTEGWGPGDDVFFAGATDWLETLDADDGPWFAVTLNAGTHHPFPAGAAERKIEDGNEASQDSKGEAIQPDRQAAFSVMARELSRFLDRLAAKEILENTLVIITSDEAGGFLRGEEGPRMLDGNFGALAVRPPGGGPLDDFARRDALVATLDIALTTLDAAGLAERSEPAGQMIGRSLLVRQPSKTRGLLLGDAYAGYIVFLRESGELIACGEGLVRCTTWRFEPQRLFGSLNEDVSAAPYLEFGTRQQLVDHAAIIEPSSDR